ncbi:MAG: hypothetical protein GY765_19235 [bacterium]|nr:hypothetical protein [bacterium]
MLKRKWFVLMAAVFFCTGMGFCAIPPEEREALIVLYNAADGDNLRPYKGWKEGDTESDGFAASGTEGKWHGVTTSDDHVTELVIHCPVISFPEEINSLTYLKKLEILTGEGFQFPDETGGLSRLKTLRLRGPFKSLPAELGNLENLETLSIRNHFFDYKLPPELGNLSKLQELHISGRCTGPIPPEFGNLENVRELTIKGNCSGPIPAALGKLTRLIRLHLKGKFTGSLPAELGELSELLTLFLAGEFTGSIPAALGKPVRLRHLRLSGFFSGSIPSELGDLEALEILKIRSLPMPIFKVPAKIAAKLPPELAAKVHIVKDGETISLKEPEADIALDGEIPSSLGQLSKLKTLDLSWNRLTGPIPPALGNLKHLVALNLGHNMLSGPIPPELCYMSALESLALGNNQLTGTIPGELENLDKLWFLYLQYNQLEGEIPEELGNMEKVKKLHLQSNNLSGELPENFANLKAMDINLAYNGLHTDSNWLEVFMKKREALFNKSVAWLDTQTVAPEGIKAVAASPTTIAVSWRPIKYSADKGGYTLSYRELPDGQWTEAVVTETKLAKSHEVTGLKPGTQYAFRMHTHTEPHEKNDNFIVGDYSKEIKVKTAQ